MPTRIDLTRPMNPKQELFVNCYLENGFRPAKAAEDAGYSTRSCSVIAQRLLRDPRVREEIDRRKAILFGNYEVTAERVIKELAHLGFSNMQDYMRVTDEGDAYLDLSEITREQASAIQQLDCETYVERSEERGKEGRTVKKCRIRLGDKKAALELLGKHVGVFKENAGGSVQVRIMYDGTRNQTQVDIGVKEG